MIESFRTTALPYTQWLLAHRNVVIVLLGIGLFFVTTQHLIARWRMEKLERDLAEARSGAKGVGRRTYAPPTPGSEGEAERGSGLPPVRGGRTYARNLGTVLQKAGVPAPVTGPAGPPIYSPPTAPGWSPPSVGGSAPSPVQSPPYPQPSVPWGSPTPAGVMSPWPYSPPQLTPTPPAGPLPPAPGGSAPPYYPPLRPGGSLPSPAPSQPPPPGPSIYAPPPVYEPPAPLVQPGPPPFLPAQAGSVPAPFASGPAGRLAPSQVPSVPVSTPPPAVLEPQQEIKPKRRRFGLNVLQSLERALQEKAASLAEASARAVAPAAPSPSPTAFPPAVPPAPAASAPPSIAAYERRIAAEPAPEPAVGQPEHPAEPAMASDAVTPPPILEQQALPVDAGPSSDSPEEARSSMRRMLFGAEPAPASRADALTTEAKPTRHVPEETAFEPSSDASAEPWSVAPIETSASAGGDAGASLVQAAPIETEPLLEEPIAEAEVHSELDTEKQPVWERVEPPATAPPKASGLGTLVLIEDDQKVAEYYVALFTGNGYRVEVATDGTSGVDLCSRLQPQVILLDVMMPRQNGILVLQTLRASEETRDTPVVVLSNFSEPTLIKRALQLGALEYVIKTQVEGAALLNAVPHWMMREKAFA